MKVIIYRYELPDGGGPFFTKDGLNRVYSNIKFNDNTLSGCGNITILDEWFRARGISTHDFVIQKYEGDFMRQTACGEIIIRKDTARKLNI